MTPFLAMRFAPPRRQRGVMLLIALIVMVAMTLAGIAMMRSVDTSAVVAGNIAFKQSAVAAADNGLQSGYVWLAASGTGTTLYNNDTSVGYLSNAPAQEPDWTLDANWANAVELNGGTPDAAGNTVSYLIHRMCPVANCAPDATCLGSVNACGSTPDTVTSTGEGIDLSKANPFTRPPAIHYRITARAQGPRNSNTVVQTMIRIQ